MIILLEEDSLQSIRLIAGSVVKFGSFDRSIERFRSNYIIFYFFKFFLSAIKYKLLDRLIRWFIFECIIFYF